MSILDTLESVSTTVQAVTRVIDTIVNLYNAFTDRPAPRPPYLTISLHPDDRHYFVFTISGIRQMQPTRMQQGSQSAGFTMTELAYRAFGPIPTPYSEPSLLHSPDPASPSSIKFYMDDFFGGF